MGIHNVTIVAESVVSLVCYLALFDQAATHFWEFSPQSPTPSSRYSRLVTKWPSDVTTAPVFNSDVGQFGRLEVTDDSAFTLSLTNVTAADAGLYRCGMSFLSGADEVDSELTNLIVTEPSILTSTKAMATNTSYDLPSISPELGSSAIAWVIPVVVITTLTTVGVLIYCIYKRRKMTADFKRVKIDTDETDGITTDKASQKLTKESTVGDERNEEAIKEDTDLYVNMLRRNLRECPSDGSNKIKQRVLRECYQAIKQLKNGMLSSAKKYQPENKKGEDEEITVFVKYAGSLLFQIGLIDNNLASILRNKIQLLVKDSKEKVSCLETNEVTTGTWYACCPDFKELLHCELQNLPKKHFDSVVKDIKRHLKNELERRRAEVSRGESFSDMKPATPTASEELSSSQKLARKRENFQRSVSVIRDNAAMISRDIQYSSKLSEKEKELLHLTILADIVYAADPLPPKSSQPSSLVHQTSIPEESGGYSEESSEEDSGALKQTLICKRSSYSDMSTGL